MRDQLLRVAYALRREGVTILNSRDGKFPTMIVFNPSERLRKNATEIRINNKGQRSVKYCANEQGVSVYWE